MTKAMTKTMKPTARGNHNGDNTHSQDQSICFVSFKTTSTTVRRVLKEVDVFIKLNLHCKGNKYVPNFQAVELHGSCLKKSPSALQALGLGPRILS